MFGRIIIFFLGLFVVFEGWHEASIAYKYKEPVKMSCQQLLAAAEKPAWVSVDDCVVYLGHYQMQYDKKTNAVTGMAVMAFASKDAAADDKVTSSVVLQISDSNKRVAIRDNLDKLNALAELKDPTPENQKEIQDRALKLFDTGNLILKEEAINEDFDLIKDRLGANHTTYAYSSLDDKSSMMTGILMMVGGLIASLAVVASFVWRKK